MGQTFYNNTLGAYTAALVTLVGLLVLFMLTKRFLVSYLGKLAQKTKGDFDDLLVRLLSQIGGGVFVMAALYIATLPLALNERLSAAIRGALILVITVRIVLMLQEILKYQIHKAYRRARPKDAPHPIHDPEDEYRAHHPGAGESLAPDTSDTKDTKEAKDAKDAKEETNE